MTCRAHPCGENARSRRTGVALLAVLIVVAAASLMCWTMIGETSLRVDAARNKIAAQTAEDMADAGLDVALYYLRNPQESSEGTVPGPDGPYWPGGTYELDNGRMVATVQRQSANNYLVTSTVTSGGISRTRQATVRREQLYLPSHALQSRLPVSLPSTWDVAGGLRSIGNVAFRPNGSPYTDRVLAANGSSFLNGSTLDSSVPPELTCPDPTTLHFYTANTYVHNGVTYTATLLTTHQSNVTLGPTPTNPLGVYIATKHVDIDPNVVIRGTLVGRDILHLDATTVIIANAGMPALIAFDDVEIRNGADVGIRGAVYAAGVIGSEAGTRLKLQGALLMYQPKEQELVKSLKGQVELIYDDRSVRLTKFTNNDPVTWRVVSRS